jgi:imidazolonepropionase-like amidohydrolase
MTVRQRNEWGRGRFLTRVVVPVVVSAMIPGARTSAESFVVRNARVFDGRQVIADADVWVEGDKIKAVGNMLDVPGDLKVVDGTGDTLLPGLIDAHTHTFGDALKEAIVFGVTTELDMFTSVDYAQQVKKDEAAGKNRDMAELRSAGTLATARGGHGTEYGFAIPTLSTPAEAKPWVAARIKEGSDYIKIVYDDCREYGFERPTLSKETMKAVIDAAHGQGKLAVVHIGTQQQARDAIEAGADGLAHLFTDSEPAADFPALVAKHHVFVVPTLTVLEGLGGRPSGESLTTDARLEPYLTPANIVNLRKVFPITASLSEKHAETAVRELKAANVPILAGTDSPNPGTSHGASLHRELELLVRSGLSPLEAISSATAIPAQTFHLDDRGQIAVGKRADLVLVKGDPTQDINATRDIVAVWKAGTPVNRETYRKGVERAKLNAKQAAKTPAPAGELGVISDFEDNKPSSKFGAGWTISTDNIAGGKSTAEMKTVAGGANGSKFSLDVSSNVDGGLPYAWAGVMFSPGEQIFAPANLSKKKEITFWAKGDGKTYRVMIFTASGGRIPAQQTFASEKDWKQYKMPLSSFNGTDGHDVAAILFVGGPAAGKFELRLDDIGLQ